MIVNSTYLIVFVEGVLKIKGLWKIVSKLLKIKDSR